MNVNALSDTRPNKTVHQTLANRNSLPTAGLKSTFSPMQDTAAAWIDLAQERGVRLPRHETPCTPGGMERWLRKLGLSAEWFKEWTGGTLRQWIAQNPTWGLRSFVGLLLEESAA